MGDIDRRKHDVDIIERVLGGIRESDAPEARTHVVDLDLPRGSGFGHPTLELTVGLEDASSDRRSSSRRRS